MAPQAGREIYPQPRRPAMPAVPGLLLRFVLLRLLGFLPPIHSFRHTM